MKNKIALVCVLLTGALGACSDDDDSGPRAGDAAPGQPDGSTTPRPDGGTTTGDKPAGAACSTGAECQGGVCFGAPGQPEEGNIRFAGGYCTSYCSMPNTQEGCGPDEVCVEGGPQTGYCVEQCSKAAGEECDRADHVCLGLGTWGGCFSNQTVECDSAAHTGCGDGEICVRIGFEDSSLGRCETLCDPMLQNCENSADSCYYIRRYNAAFCGVTGTTPPGESCACDKCCTETYACTPDTDGTTGRHCKQYCTVSEGCAGGTCVPIEPGSPWGGCALPGTPGT